MTYTIETTQFGFWLEIFRVDGSLLVARSGES